MTLIRRLSFALALVLTAGPFAAPAREALAEDVAGRDVLVLQDGRKLEGAVVAETAEGVTFRTGGTTRFYPADQVARTDKAPAAPAPAPGAAGDPPAAAPGDPAAPAKPGLDKMKRPKVLTDESRKWVRELAARAATTDDIVRRSVAAALRACGPAAVPTIREAAAAEADPATRTFLESLATEMAEGRQGKGGAPTPPTAAKPPMPAGEDGMGDAPGEKPEMGGPAGRPGRRGGLFEKVAQDLELRDDQRLRFRGVLGALEQARGQAFKEHENGGTLDAARAKIADAKKSVLEGAKAVLDEGQMAAFEPMVDRYVMEQESRLTKVAARKGGETPPGEKTPEKQPE